MCYTTAVRQSICGRAEVVSMHVCALCISRVENYMHLDNSIIFLFLSGPGGICRVKACRAGVLAGSTRGD
jgi:hypothetical protein